MRLPTPAPQAQDRRCLTPMKQTQVTGPRGGSGPPAQAPRYLFLCTLDRKCSFMLVRSTK